ncbi:phosphopantetheine binding protein [Couchioplanes caeruleus]|uniref:Phosphopantetheine binding protein n=1 Tax=Couchioplanes caeruleus TaxID=56438 RepID=A0A3N1GM19_9ACTN|nr:phosphopantetheine binding protein [Couchioplanes caeruleus]
MADPEFRALQLPVLRAGLSPVEADRVVRQFLSELVRQPVRPDNFFDLGGHSLIAAARELTQRTGTTVSPGMILSAADVSALIDRIVVAGSEPDA